MNLVDSSGWLEYFADGPNADFFAPAIEQSAELIVSTISLYEVFKKVLQQRGDGPALQAIAIMQQGSVVSLDTSLAFSAANTSIELGLPMADSIVLATARTHNATLWTQDSHFEGVEGIRYIRKG